MPREAGFISITSSFEGFMTALRLSRDDHESAPRPPISGVFRNSDEGALLGFRANLRTFEGRFRTIAYDARGCRAGNVSSRRRRTTDTKQASKKALSTPHAPDFFTDRLIEPFTQLRGEVDRLFESLPFRLPSLRAGPFTSVPALEMSETDKSYKITAELPGIEPEDVQVTFDEGILRISGEKKEEREENERGYRLSERSYGAFER